MKKLLLPACIVIATLLLFSCKKDGFITNSDARLNISVDSVKFDTVFTSTGSVTQSFKIFNENDQKLRLSVKLMGGNSSPFKININGAAVPEIPNLEIAAEDSIYIFVSVTVNPTAANQPFILSDSIQVNYNGNTRFVQLQAYGQNAIFLNNTIINSSTTWNNSRPYVILGGLQVNNGATLTIPAGTKIYSHADAPFLVDGTLLVNGSKDEPVLFTGDRLDEPYRDFPASWPGIYIRQTSRNSVIRFATIKNAFQAIVVQGPSVNANPKLVLHQSVVDNASDKGLFCSNTSVQADNSLFSNCGTNISIQLGGTYNFTNCTVAAVSNDFILHKTAVLRAVNFAEINGATQTQAMSALFKNCIFWGDNNSLESELDIQKQGAEPFAVTMDHCLYKANADPANTTFTASINNLDPLFDSIDVRGKYYDFRIAKYGGPAVDAGVATGFTKDLDDKNRSVGPTDIGCYEKQ